MQHRRLAQDDKLLQPRLQNVTLRAQFVQGIGIKGADDERIAHACERMFLVAAAVEGDGGDTDILRLPRHGENGVRERPRPPIIAALARLRVGIRTGRNDARHVNNIVRSLHKCAADGGIAKISEYDLQPAAVFLLQFSGERSIALSGREQDAHPLRTGKRKRLCERLRAHVSAHARHGDLHWFFSDLFL